LCGRAGGNSHEKDNNRECGALSCASVFCVDGRGTCNRRRAWGGIGRSGARADRCRGWRLGRLCCWSIDCEFLGLQTIRHYPAGTESRKPGRSCPCTRQSACTQSLCSHRSSSSSSGRPSAAVRHHHGFHRAAGPATGVSRRRGFGPAPNFTRSCEARGCALSSGDRGLRNPIDGIARDLPPAV
jgi:hypothetical protein